MRRSGLTSEHDRGNQLQRCLRLLSIGAGTFEDLGSRFGVHPRTIHRDVLAICASGVSINIIGCWRGGRFKILEIPKWGQR